MSHLHLEIKDLTRHDLNNLLDQAPYSTVLQSFSHAIAMRYTNYINSKLCLIKKENEVIGFTIIQEGKLLWGLLHAITLDRGPIWLKRRNKPEYIKEFITLFNTHFKKRLGRRRRLMLETPDSEDLKTFILTNGWSLQKNTSLYQTIIIDLTKPYDDILKTYHSKWRNALNKANKQNLEIEVDFTGKRLNTLLSHYDEHKDELGYKGPSLHYLTHLYKDLISDQKLLIMTAFKEQKIHSIIAIPLHGQSATYQTAWTSPLGRSSNANYFLMDQAIRYLQEKGFSYFDLGGINETHAGGVTQFKKRISQKVTTLIGQFE